MRASGTGLLADPSRQSMSPLDVSDVADLGDAVSTTGHVAQGLDQQSPTALRRPFRQCREERELVCHAPLAGAGDERDGAVEISLTSEIEDRVLHGGPVWPRVGVDPGVEVPRATCHDPWPGRLSTAIGHEHLDRRPGIPHQPPGMSSADAGERTGSPHEEQSRNGLHLPASPTRFGQVDARVHGEPTTRLDLPPEPVGADPRVEGLGPREQARLAVDTRLQQSCLAVQVLAHPLIVVQDSSRRQASSTAKTRGRGREHLSGPGHRFLLTTEG